MKRRTAHVADTINVNPSANQQLDSGKVSRASGDMQQAIPRRINKGQRIKELVDIV